MFTNNACCCYATIQDDVPVVLVATRVKLKQDGSLNQSYPKFVYAHLVENDQNAASRDARFSLNSKQVGYNPSVSTLAAEVVEQSGHMPTHSASPS